jgi:hypothetical protein
VINILKGRIFIILKKKVKMENKILTNYFVAHLKAGKDEELLKKQALMKHYPAKDIDESMKTAKEKILKIKDPVKEEIKSSSHMRIAILLWVLVIVALIILGILAHNYLKEKADYDENQGRIKEAGISESELEGSYIDCGEVTNTALEITNPMNYLSENPAEMQSFLCVAQSMGKGTGFELQMETSSIKADVELNDYKVVYESDDKSFECMFTRNQIILASQQAEEIGELETAGIGLIKNLKSNMKGKDISEEVYIDFHNPATLEIEKVPCKIY